MGKKHADDPRASGKSHKKTEKTTVNEIVGKAMTSEVEQPKDERNW
jgi:hypothetical protein